MTWSAFYHWLTTSRYTRRLEAEIETLRAEIIRLRTDNEGLVCALYPQVKRVRMEADAKPDRPVKAVGAFNSW